MILDKLPKSINCIRLTFLNEKLLGGIQMPASVAFLWFGVPVIYVLLAIGYFYLSREEE